MIRSFKIIIDNKLTRCNLLINELPLDINKPVEIELIVEVKD